MGAAMDVAAKPECRTMPTKTFFTTDFIAVPSDQVRVRGLPHRSAGASVVGWGILSSLAGIFTISPDIAQFLPPAPVSIAMKPATTPVSLTFESRERRFELAGELLSIGD